MARTLSFPRLSLRRLATYGILTALGGATAAAGCGNGGSGNTGAGGDFPMATSSGTGTGKGGEGGTLFGNTSSNSNTNSTGSDTTTGGPAPGMPCKSATTSMGMSQWAHNYGDSSGQYGLAVTTDASGNIYVAGSYSGNLSFGTKTADITNANKAVFVAKLAADGTPQWVRGFAAVQVAGNALPLAISRAVVTDSTGNVYIAGDFTGKVTFDGKSLTSAGGFFGDMFLVKLDPTGVVQYANRVGDPPSTPSSGGSTQTARGLSLHKTPTGDQIALVGDAEGVLDLAGDGTKTYTGGGVAAGFVAVYYTTNLAPHFGALFGDGTVKQSTRSVAFDKNSDLLVTGFTTGATTFPGGTAMTPAGTQDAFVAKIKGDGSGTTWAKLYGSGTASGEAITTDASGNIYVAGDHQGMIDFGGGGIDNAFGANVFAAGLDGNGGHLWSKTYGDSMAQHAHGIAVDGMGRVVLAGQFSGTLQLGGGLLTSAGGDDIFVGRLDSKGCQIWAKNFGDTSLQAANAVTVDATGNAILVGSMSGSVDFGGGALSAMGDDVFVAKFAP